MKQTKKATGKAASKTTKKPPARTANKTKATVAPAKKPVAASVKPAQAVKKIAPVTVAAKPVVQAAAPTAAPRREITTESIAACAFTLWEQSGRPQGRDMEFWLKAEQMLKQETQSLAA